MQFWVVIISIPVSPSFRITIWMMGYIISYMHFPGALCLNTGRKKWWHGLVMTMIRQPVCLLGYCTPIWLLIWRQVNSVTGIWRLMYTKHFLNKFQVISTYLVILECSMNVCTHRYCTDEYDLLQWQYFYSMVLVEPISTIYISIQDRHKMSLEVLKCPAPDQLRLGSEMPDIMMSRQLGVTSFFTPLTSQWFYGLTYCSSQEVNVNTSILVSRQDVDVTLELI